MGKRIKRKIQIVLRLARQVVRGVIKKPVQNNNKKQMVSKNIELFYKSLFVFFHVQGLLVL